MNKTLLSTALLTLLSTVTHADNRAQPATSSDAAGTKSAAPAMAQPANPLPAAEPTKATIPTPPQPAAVIDCKYRIPAETTNIEQSLLSTWAGKAAVQSFNFNPTTIDEELGALKLCYTEQGWQGFNDALQKSGNVNAIKLQHLTVSSQVDGELKVNVIKDNQWKVTVPLQVVYQNDKEKLTQLLAIDLLVGRKVSGDLGIMQMIATPRQAGAPQAPAATGTQEPVAGDQAKQEPGTTEAQKPAVENTQPAQPPRP